MSNDENNLKDKSNNIIHLGSFDFAGKGSGSFLGGVVKLYADHKEDLLDSAKSFLKAADRCLNSCKVEDGVEILIVPGAVCASFACELFLKYIIIAESGEKAKGHHLAELFRKCSNDTQLALTELRTDIIEILERNDTQFVEARYQHEKNCISFRQQELVQTAELLSKFITERYQNGGA